MKMIDFLQNKTNARTPRSLNCEKNEIVLAIKKYINKINSSDITYDFFDFTRVSSDLKFSSKKYFIEKTEKTDTSLFEREFGYKLPDYIAEYLNAYYHPGIFGYDQFYECICLFSVVKYAGESPDNIFNNRIIKHMKSFRNVYGGDITSYIPIGFFANSASYILYEVKTGRIFAEDFNEDGKPEEMPFEKSLTELILKLEPVMPPYMKMKFELSDGENDSMNKKDFPYVKCIESGQCYYVLADGKPWLCVETAAKRLFDTAVIYCHYLLIGSGDKVYIINLWELESKDIKIRRIDLDMYFRHFCVLSEFDRILISDATGIIALKGNMIQTWENHTLATDGIVFEEMNGCKMKISCNLGPPNSSGWVKKQIDIWTGKVLE